MRDRAGGLSDRIYTIPSVYIRPAHCSKMHTWIIQVQLDRADRLYGQRGAINR